MRIKGLLDLESVTLRCQLVCEDCFFDSLEAFVLDYATATRIALLRCELAGLTGDTLTVTREVDLTDTAFTDGAVRLLGADIKGQLSLRGATLAGTDNNGNALHADRVKVGGGVFLNGGFTATGAVLLRGASIGGMLSLDGAKLSGPVALIASDMRVGQELRWRPTQLVDGLVDLERTSVRRLVDDWSLPDAHWPLQERLRLAGFTYEGFGGPHQATWKQRLGWIRRSHTTPSTGKSASFASQPYGQLAGVYRQIGQEKEAREISIACRDDLRTYGDLGRLGKVGNRVFGVIFAHGYKPLRAVWWLIGVYILVFLALLLAQHQDAVVPAKPTTTLSALWQTGPRSKSVVRVIIRTEMPVGA